MSAVDLSSSLDVGAQPVDGGTALDNVDAGPPVMPSTSPASNSVVSFDGGARCVQTVDATIPREAEPTISASMLLLKGSAAWNVGSPSVPSSSTPAHSAMPEGATKVTPSAPRLLAEPITDGTAPAKTPVDQKPVQLKVPWISQFDTTVELRNSGGNVIPPEKRGTACAATAKEMLHRAGAELAGANFFIADAKDTKGRMVPNQERATQAHAYIDSQLEQGKPVIVGVLWNTPTPGYNDGHSDHFVVITGRGTDEQGNAWYSFNDPAAGNGRGDVGSDARVKNRFFVDEKTGQLYRPGLQQERAYTTDSRFEVSRVSVNR